MQKLSSKLITSLTFFLKVEKLHSHNLHMTPQDLHFYTSQFSFYNLFSFVKQKKLLFDIFERVKLISFKIVLQKSLFSFAKTILMKKTNDDTLSQ